MSDFSVVVQDNSRRLTWLEILGSDSLPVRSYLPEWSEIDGFDEAQPVYFLDLDSLTGEQRERLARHLATRFGLPLVQVRVRLQEHGVPILARDCTVTVRNPHKWLV